jgi:hypothetical protein
MHGDYSLWLIGLAIALLISILTARSYSQRANREQADRIKAQGEIRQKTEELSQLRQTHSKMLAAVESRSRKSAQGDKWSFCLMAGTLCSANQERP